MYHVRVFLLYNIALVSRIPWRWFLSEERCFFPPFATRFLMFFFPLECVYIHIS